ncbi:aldolase [Glaciimonas sp. PCH181]|uniref:3-oxo-tetronate 4-phosphate decarboxylase n=1 Tax=Glaciimonas sp. PCH181 TaxID=2133943 RepID=UPI000D38DC37|nr:aldolase [Glaciimonas sp. PCH181]PUA20479.1 aldolase [Glaciimonas sp. PCH181]
MSTTTHSTSLKETALREEICRVGASLFQRNYTVGSSGNISARLEDGWLITPTDACLGLLDPARIAKVDASGKWISGDKPSKTLTLHRAVYDNNSSAQSVLHMHSTNLVALTLAGVWSKDDVLPPITPYQVMKVGHIPLIPYCLPGHASVAEQVSLLANSVRGVLLERLGPVVWHQSIAQAAYVLEELEETARLWMMLQDKPAALSVAEIEALCKTFGVRW